MRFKAWRTPNSLYVVFTALAFFLCAHSSQAQWTNVNVNITSGTWTDTGIAVTAGQNLVINGGGNVDWNTDNTCGSGNCNVTPQGLPWSSCSTFTPAFFTPGLRCWSMVAKVGSGTPFQVGNNSNNSFVGSAPNSGELYVGMNDNYYGDNTGAWVASINPTGKLAGCSCNDTTNGQVSPTGGSPTGSGLGSAAPSITGLPQLRSADYLVDYASGNFFYQQTDYTTSGQNPLAFTRYYNSQAGYAGVPSLGIALVGTGKLNGPMGADWRTNYERYLQLSSSRVTLEQPDGRQLVFSLVSGVWTPDSDVDMTLTNSGSTWTLTDNHDTVETYSAISSSAALLSSITQRNGYTQTLAYNGSNQLTSVTDMYGRELSFTYNSQGNIATVTTPDSTTITYGYTLPSTSGGYNLTSVSYATSPTSEVQYSYGYTTIAPNTLTSIKDEDGNTILTVGYTAYFLATSTELGTSSYPVSYAYTESPSTVVNNPLSVPFTYYFTTLQGTPKITYISRAATGTTTAATRTLAYDSNGYLNSATDWDGNTTTYVNNSHGRPTTINEAVGSSVARTTTIAYDSTWVRLPHTITTPGVTIGYTYDSYGEPLTKTLTDTTTNTVPYSTNGQTRTWTFTWGSSLLASVKTPKNNTTSYGYDSTGALTSVTDPLSHVTNITSHTGGGLPETIVDPNSVTTTLAYSPRQWLTSSSVSGTDGTYTTTYTYDPAGNLTKTTWPDSSYLSNTFDVSHRVTKVTNANGDYTAFTLNAFGESTATKIYDSSNTLWKSHTATYDALSRKLTDVGGESQTTTFTYDKNGNALTVEDGLSHTTTNTFDALNRLSTSTDANSGVTTVAYDAHNRPLTVTDALSHATGFVYDGFGDGTQQNSPDSGTTVYHFDADANLTQKVDALSVTANMAYDALDRVSSRTYPADSTQNVSYTYDATTGIHYNGIGRLTTMTDPAGTLNYGYDERGHITYQERTSGSNTFNVFPQYDAAGRPNGITYPSGLFVASNRNSIGEIGQQELLPPGSGTFQVVTYNNYAPFYGPLDYITFGTDAQDSLNVDQDYRTTQFKVITTSGTLTNQTYTYDNANNLTGVSDSISAANNQTLGYDVINRLTSAVSGTGGYGSYSWTYDKVGNRLTQTVGGTATTNSYTSGTNRLSAIGSTSVSTNANGNITSIPPANSSSSATFAYNVANRLSSVTGTSLAATFVYDGNGQRFSKTQSGYSPIYYTYAPDGTMLEENDGGAVTDYIYLNGAPVGTFVPATGALYFLHDDRQGVPQMASNSSQAIVWSTAYQPFGTTGTITTSITQNQRFPGQYAEVETGFRQNNARDYMPNLGRYLETDPIGLGDGMNTYAYARNNPTSFTDRSGLFFNPTLPLNPSTGQQIGRILNPAVGDGGGFLGPMLGPLATVGGILWPDSTAPPEDDEPQTPYVPTGADAQEQQRFNSNPSLNQNASDPTQCHKVTFKHGGRHLEGTGLSQSDVENAIISDIDQIINSSDGTGSFWGQVSIDGQNVFYRAYTLPNGTINVGTYTVGKP